MKEMITERERISKACNTANQELETTQMELVKLNSVHEELLEKVVVSHQAVRRRRLASSSSTSSSMHAATLLRRWWRSWTHCERCSRQSGRDTPQNCVHCELSCSSRC